MYVKYGYYNNNFKGTVIPKEDFQRSGQEAETYIRYLTYLNGDIFADTAQADAIKGAVCAAADAYHMAVRETAEGGNVKSESKDGLSVSFVVARKDGETADDYVKRCMYQVIRIRLLPTGWLSRKAGCKHDHKCGCCDCL